MIPMVHVYTLLRETMILLCSKDVQQRIANRAAPGVNIENRWLNTFNCLVLSDCDTLEHVNFVVIFFVTFLFWMPNLSDE